MKILMSKRQKASAIRGAFSGAHFDYYGTVDPDTEIVRLNELSVRKKGSENNISSFSAKAKSENRENTRQKALAKIFDQIVKTLGYDGKSIETIKTDENIIVRDLASDRYDHYELAVIITGEHVRFEEPALV